MSYSIQRAVSDGTLSSLSLSIQFYNRADISVYLGNVLWPVNTVWSWVGATGSTIKFKDPVPAGIEVMVKRITDVSDIRHNFSQGAQFTSGTLDDNFKQMLFVAQEAQEGGRTITDVFGDIDMHGFKVRNMGAATELSGAAQLAQAGGGSTGNTPGITYQPFTGDGVTTAFPLTSSSLSMFVFVTGVYQQSTSWSLVGPNIVFSEAPPKGTPIEVLSLGTVGSSAVSTSFSPTASVPYTNAQAAIEGVAASIDKLSGRVANTADAINVVAYGADPTGVTPAASAFNTAIAAQYAKGGGTVSAVGTFKIAELSSVFVPSNVYLDLTGATLVGAGLGKGTLVCSGWVDNGVLKDLTLEYGTSTTGSGTHFASGATIKGGRFKECGFGIRVHRFNWGSSIENCWFDSTCTWSYMSMQSWGLSVQRCTLFAPSIMKDFVDWSEVSNNNWEGASSTTEFRPALTVEGIYGGSYSLRLISNGFHHYVTAVAIKTETTNMVIQGNHFEDVKYHVSGNTLNQYNIDISRNWMKANLPAAGTGVIAISLLNSKNGTIGPNYYSTDGSSTFDAYVAMDSVDCIGNTVNMPYRPDGTIDTSMYRLNVSNIAVQYGGSNNPTVAAPSVEYLAGTGAYTYEVYKRRYNFVANAIPFCSVNYTGTTVVIDTWIPSDAFGVKSRVAYNFSLAGATSYFCAGDIIGFTHIAKASFDRYTPATAGPVVTPSMSNNALRLTISGVSAGGNISGWVKQL